MTLKLSLPSHQTSIIPAATRAELVRTHGEAYTANYEFGARQERERCRFITMSPAARGRETAALLIATQTNMEPEAAVRLLASLPGPAEADAVAGGDAAAAVSWADVVASLTAGAKH